MRKHYIQSFLIDFLPSCSMDGVQGYGYSRVLQRFITSSLDSEVPRPWWDTDLGQKPLPSRRPGPALCAVCSEPAPHRCGGCKASRYWYAHVGPDACTDGSSLAQAAASWCPLISSCKNLHGLIIHHPGFIRWEPPEIKIATYKLSSVGWEYERLSTESRERHASKISQSF